MQKFHKGDLVRVAKDLGPSMRHFTADCDAIVIGSYADQYRHGSNNSFTLFLKDRGVASWYDGEQLTLIESGRIDLLEAWEAKAEEERKIHSDLDWIFSNGVAVSENPENASIQALATCLGLKDLWGSSGEGFTHFTNTVHTMLVAKPFLLTGDKAGWLALCKTLKTKTGETT